MTYISRSRNYALYREEFSQSSDFALYLEDYFMYKHHILSDYESV